MQKTLGIVALLTCLVCGCAGGNLNRPCGPGYLGNIFVAQQSWGADFRPACHTHDACYGTPCADRDACDEQFLDDMNCACECATCPTLCRLRAKRWYWQVRLCGRSSFRQAQRQADCNCAPPVAE